MVVVRFYDILASDPCLWRRVSGAFRPLIALVKFSGFGAHEWWCGRFGRWVLLNLCPGIRVRGAWAWEAPSPPAALRGPGVDNCIWLILSRGSDRIRGDLFVFFFFMS